jgi:ABC-type polysaccharide/polyol phosphate export permease
VIFFVTPVVRLPALIEPGRGADFTPPCKLIVLAREPLLGRAADVKNCVVDIAIAAASFVLVMLVCDRFRARVVFWQ